ncbi:MAG: hypothetical protein IJ711_08460 [Lachnospiraceae bacterium]|nr:hypothetical protein [Lachnospiraceae bacterium]
MRKSSYMFTNKRHPAKGIVSTLLGCLDIACLVLVVVLSFQAKGNATVRAAVVTMFALLFSAVGFVMGVMSRMEKDRFYLFSNIGIATNFVVIAFIIFMLVAGAA